MSSEHEHDAAHMRLGADLVDAIDIDHTSDQRVNATVRMLTTDPELALTLAVGLLYGLVEDTERARPGAGRQLVRRLRATIGHQG